jgi:uncharacterized MAPEG superfamily protein
MTRELWILAWSSAFCLLMWLPYIMARIGAWGLVDAVGYPQNPPALPAWAVRAQKAHANMVENLAPFAAIVLIAHVADVHNGATELGAMLFLGGRLVHYPAYVAGVPWIRTLSFAVAWLGSLLIFLQLYGTATAGAGM